MPIITPDTSEMQEFKPIDPGTYPARIVQVDSGTSGTGNPKIVVTMQVEVDGKEIKRQAHLVTKGPGSFNFDQILRATGQGEYADELKKNPGLPFDTDVMVGQTIQVVIDHQLYQGETRDQIKSYLRS